MNKFMPTKLRLMFGAAMTFGIAGMVSGMAEEAASPSIKEVAAHHISIIEGRLNEDLSTLENDKDLRPQCQNLAGDYTRQLYGGIILIIEEVSMTGNTSNPIHEAVAPFGAAYLAADCPGGQIAWLGHQKRSAITYVMNEFIPDIISAFAGTSA